jgi:arylsulfatase A-like enzyme
LEASGDGERTIIVFTSDHGEEFEDHGGLQHSSTLYEELIRIPLIMAVPGFRPQRVDTVVSQSDIAPTLLSLAGLPVPEEFSGTPLHTDRDHFAPGAGRTIFAETFRGGGEQRSVIFGNWKLILNLTEQRTELYDLAADRVEARNRAEAEPRAVERGLRLLEEHYAQQRRQPEEMPPYPELQQQLESLGYLEETDSARGHP